LEAFANVVHTTDRPQRLILIGDGPERRRIESRISALALDQTVTLPGYLNPEGVAATFQQSHAAVWASDLETFGVAPVEALACGLPVIIPHCGGPADYINDENGIMTPPGDQESLTGAMLRLQNRILRYNRKNIRQSILSYCGEQAFVSQIQAVGKALIKNV